MTDNTREARPIVLAILAKVVPSDAVVDIVGALGDDRVVQDDVQVSNWA